MARKTRTAPVAPVTWRDGVYLTGTPIWCDARRRRDVCFVSSADRVGKTGHGQLIATHDTLALLGANAKSAGHLAVPLHRPFTLGTLRLELIPSGRGVGAAALHVDLGDRSVLYAGAIRTVTAREPAEVRACDAVIVAAPVADALEPLETVAARLCEWTSAQLAAGKRPVLVVDHVLDAIEVASHLQPMFRDIGGTRTLAEALGTIAPQRYANVLVRVLADRLKILPTDAVTTVSLRGDFRWPFAADRDQLLGWIEQTRAKEIFVTDVCADAIVAALGPRARVLEPPRQMALFGS